MDSNVDIGIVSIITTAPDTDCVFECEVSSNEILRYKNYITNRNSTYLFAFTSSSSYIFTEI